MSEERNWPGIWPCITGVLVALLVTVCLAGLPPFIAIAIILAAAAIQAGIHGFLPTGYSFGARQISGWPARLLGGVSIAAGMAIVIGTGIFVFLSLFA